MAENSEPTLEQIAVAERILERLRPDFKDMSEEERSTMVLKGLAAAAREEQSYRRNLVEE